MQLLIPVSTEALELLLKNKEALSCVLSADLMPVGSFKYYPCFRRRYRHRFMCFFFLWFIELVAAAANIAIFLQFVGLWTCGHMMSKKALDATRDSSATPAHDAAADADAATPGAGNCPVCSAAFTAADVVPILPSEADREARRRCVASMHIIL
jgi:hypothetical protein